jgi:hypothetical protein
MCTGFIDVLPRLNHRHRKVKPAFTSLEPNQAYSSCMDIGFDHNAMRQAQSTGGCPAAPDWPLLRARLDAAWAARRALCHAAAHAASPRGSFNPATARAIVGLGQSSLSVNPTALGNRKPNEDIDAAVAGASLAGGRGT